MLPMLQFLDSTHVAEVEWYRTFVFNPKLQLCRKGGFIEDKFGQAQVKTLAAKGFPDGWLPFKTWLYCEPEGHAPMPYVSHVDGRAFKEEDTAELHEGDSRRQRQTVQGRLDRLKRVFNARDNHA